MFTKSSIYNDGFPVLKTITMVLNIKKEKAGVG